MPCNVIQVDGVTAIVCTRSRGRADLCEECRTRPAELECDGLVLVDVAGGLGAVQGAQRRGVKTCDRKLCRRCAIHVGPNRDLCRHCAAEAERLAAELGAC